MSHTVRMQAFVQVDLEDIEECIAKEYRHYVKLKSREEPYEVDEDTYERVLAWIAEMNAKREEPKPCPFCGAEASIVKNRRTYYIGCTNSDCLVWANTQICWYATEEEAIAAWNRRA